MSEITYDEMLPETRALFEAGEDKTLHAVTNVAFGTPGWHVLALVRRGLWVEKRRHVANVPELSYTVYGPKQ